MKPIIINQMRGLNTSRARLQLQPGEVGCLQNVRTRPFDNWAKRKGVDTSLVQDGAVNGIFEWDMDEIVMPCYQAGDTLTFFPVVPLTVESQGGSGVTSVTPDPLPPYDPLDPLGTQTSGAVSFGLEAAMRALQERVCRRGGTPIDWPNAVYDANGNSSTVVCATQPLSNFYGSASTAVDMPQQGLYRYDCYYSASYRTSLVQSVVNALDAEATLWLQVYPEGQSALTTFTSSTLWETGSKPTATATNYMTVLGYVRNALKGLKYFAAGASWTDGGEASGGSSGQASCDDAKTAATAAWGSFVSGNPFVYTRVVTSRDNFTTLYSAAIIRERARATSDLSSYKSGTAALFLKSSAYTGGYSNESSCPVTADGNWHIKSSATVGSVWTGSLLNDNSSPPSFTTMGCPFNGATQGWSLTPTVIILFRFTYPA